MATPELEMPPTPASSTTTRSSLPHTTARSSLLQELQELWLEIGESDDMREKMTQELEQKCLDIYKEKVDETRKYRDELQRSLSEAEAEIASLISTLGEQKGASLKDRISTVKPLLEDLRMKKDLKGKELSEILTQIAEISSNIAGNDYPCSSGDLTQTTLDGLKAYLQYLHNEKAVRLQKVNSYISVVHELSEIMSFDLSEALLKVHESLTGCSLSISDDTLAGLTELVESRKKEKHQRLLQLQGLLRTMHELWELMETPVDERGRFGHFSSLLSQAADDALEKGCLGLDILREAEAEVERLNALNESQDKMKVLPIKKAKTVYIQTRETN
ncbi:unnamed protein product [Arabidopsis arenosa]|uniref:Uncharacterized protein n=1 Tax=Arabidopsis arenosa TaxID=38785 RepID=A0A8S2A1B3_ARAAE|nr:unnamed protein product [Arabidopsis arenosa]